MIGSLAFPAAPQSAPLGSPGVYLQYQGFEQTGNLRAYRFKLISRQGAPRELIVTADLGLFAKHHVAIQDGPGLSLRLIAADSPALQSLSEPDLLAHAARQRAARTAGAPGGSRKHDPE